MYRILGSSVSFAIEFRRICHAYFQAINSLLTGWLFREYWPIKTTIISFTACSANVTHSSTVFFHWTNVVGSKTIIYLDKNIDVRCIFRWQGVNIVVMIIRPYYAILFPYYGPTVALLCPYFSPTTALPQPYHCPTIALPRHTMVPSRFNPLSESWIRPELMYSHDYPPGQL